MLMETKATHPEHRARRNITAVTLLLLGNVVLFLTRFLLYKYDNVCLDQFLFQMKTTTVGVHRALAGSVVVRVGMFSIAATFAEIALYAILSGRAGKYIRERWYADYCISRPCAFFRAKPVQLAMIGLIIGCTYFADQLNVVAYAHAAATDSDFIEDHYVDPRAASIAFPEEKRNLVYIYLESMESTFADPAAGGAITEDFIPELSALARQNVNFSNDEGLGGALSSSGTTWTAAAMVTQTAGVPVKIALTAEDAYGADENFMPGVVSIGEILQQAGYEQVLLCGSVAEFHGREAYFTNHGGYAILDTEALKAAGRLDEDYREWWGFEDEKLFAYAKEELTRLAGQNQPFNLTMLTADTHFPNGYECRLCQNEHESQYANVLRCSSRQVADFVDWMRQQPFWQNTTVIISCDHLTMDSLFMEDVEPDYVRTVYNCIINAPKTPVNEKNRQFATFDMLPTTLSALGADIAGNRLGLGTDLFSDTPTLTEQYGYETLESELMKDSPFYKARFLGMDVDEDE